MDFAERKHKATIYSGGIAYEGSINVYHKLACAGDEAKLFNWFGFFIEDIQLDDKNEKITEFTIENKDLDIKRKYTPGTKSAESQEANAVAEIKPEPITHALKRDGTFVYNPTQVWVATFSADAIKMLIDEAGENKISEFFARRYEEAIKEKIKPLGLFMSELDGLKYCELSSKNAQLESTRTGIEQIGTFDLANLANKAPEAVARYISEVKEKVESSKPFTDMQMIQKPELERAKEQIDTYISAINNLTHKI